VLEILKDADRQIQSGKGAGKVRTE
jgi:hypothetical protein